MKVVFFNRFFAPDTSATSQILSDLAFDLADRGEDVHVVTSRVPGGESSHERIHSVTVHRVSGSAPGQHGIMRRAGAYASYYRGARRLARTLLTAGDIAVIKTDPPMLSSVVAPIAKDRGARVIVWLQDLFPEVAQQYGIPGMNGPIGRLLARARNHSLALAESIVVISEGMAKRVSAMECRARTHVIHNWADGRSVVPSEPSTVTLRKEWNLDGKFVVGYSGNLGRVHEFETILAAASRLREHDDIVFMIVGRGPRLEEVKKAVARDGLENVLFQPQQPRAALAQSLGAANVHLSVLQSRYEGLVHPSKLYGILAAGRPTIFIGSLEGETARILRRHECGISVASGDDRALAASIIRLRDQPDVAAAMGQRARRSFEAAYDMPIALDKWVKLLGIAQQPAPSSVRTSANA
jgi:glycosyltransferase involved in cell wall biosynthesis